MDKNFFVGLRYDSELFKKNNPVYIKTIMSALLKTHTDLKYVKRI
jgi:hypothetical protein